MNIFLKWYLIGAAISLLIQLILMTTSNRVKVSMIIGYVLNTALSWGCLATFICQTVIEFLERKHLNKVLWESKAYKEYQKKYKNAGKR